MNFGACSVIPRVIKPIRLFFANSVHRKRISTAESTRDLGVFVTTNFKPSLNARLAFSRARARLFQVRRGFVVMTKEAFLPLYLSLIRLILEYSIQAVSPYLQKDIVLTGRLQKLATRLVKGLRHFPYERRLELFGLPSLVHLRLRADLDLVYHMLHGRVKPTQ